MSEMSAFAGQKVLITGASGFVGSHLCRRLLREGAEVFGISRRPQEAPKNDVRWIQGDVADFSSVRRRFAEIRPEIIFHLASHVTGTRDLAAVLPTFQANLASTVNVLMIATELGCRRVVLAGSLEQPESVSEPPCSPYAAAKSASRGYAQMFHALYGTPAVTARVFMAYGPGQHDASKLIPHTILSLLRREAPRLGKGLRLVDWIYVGDLVEGFLAIARTPAVEGTMIDLGSGMLVSIRDVVHRIAEIIGGAVQPVFGAIPDRPLERVATADVARTREVTGWRPSTPLDEGLRETVRWFRNCAADSVVELRS